MATFYREVAAKWPGEGNYLAPKRQESGNKCEVHKPPKSDIGMSVMLEGCSGLGGKLDS